MDKTLFDKFILLLRRSAGISRELHDLFSKILKDLASAIDLDLPIAENIRLIKKTIRANNISESLNNALLGVSASVVAIESKFKPIKPTLALINRALSVIMPDLNISTKDMISKMAGLTEQSVINYTHQAYNAGWTKRELVNALKTTEAQSLRHITTIANTAVNAVSNETKREIYKRDDRIDRILFSATLDSRTSSTCKSLDGKVFIIEDAPHLPLHPNERSQLLPVLVGEDAEKVISDLLPRPAVEPKDKEIYDEKGLTTATGKTRKPSSTDRSPLKGVQSQSENYEAWFKKQPAYYQDDIVGVKAGKAFRSGEKLTNVIKISPITQGFLDKALN